MADVQHKNLTGSDLHEPKGAAAVGSADLVYKSDGAGSGSWGKVNGDELDSTGSSIGEVLISDGAGGTDWQTAGGAVFGEMKVVNNTTTFSLTQAGDTTLNTDSQYVQIDNGLWTTGEVNGVTFNAAGYLEIVTAGLYEISTWMSLAIAAAGTNILAVKYSTDNTTSNLSPRKLKRQSNNSGDIGSIAASGFMTLAVGDKISLFSATDASGTNAVTIHDAGLTVTLLQAS